MIFLEQRSFQSSTLLCRSTKPDRLKCNWSQLASYSFAPDNCLPTWTASSYISQLLDNLLSPQAKPHATRNLSGRTGMDIHREETYLELAEEVKRSNSEEIQARCSNKDKDNMTQMANMLRLRASNSSKALHSQLRAQTRFAAQSPLQETEPAVSRHASDFGWGGLPPTHLFL